MPICFSLSSLMMRMREGGSVARILLKDLPRLVAVITELAGPEIGIMAAEAVHEPNAAALPILSSSSWSTGLLEYGSTPNRAA